MAEASRQVDIVLQAQDRASGVFKQVGENLRKELGDARGVLGRTSGLGQMSRLLAGGGAAAGLTMGAALLDRMAQAGIELRDSLSRSEMNAADIAQHFGRSIPLLSQFVSAGESIHELLTGQEASLRRMREESELDVRIMQSRLDAQTQLNTRTREYEQVLKDIRNEQRMLRAEGTERDLLGVRIGSEKRQEALAEPHEKRIQEIDRVLQLARTSGEDELKELRELDAEMADLNQKLHARERALRQARERAERPPMESGQFAGVGDLNRRQDLERAEAAHAQALEQLEDRRRKFSDERLNEEERANTLRAEEQQRAGIESERMIEGHHARTRGMWQRFGVELMRIAAGDRDAQREQLKQDLERQVGDAEGIVQNLAARATMKAGLFGFDLMRITAGDRDVLRAQLKQDLEQQVRDAEGIVQGLAARATMKVRLFGFDAETRKREAADIEEEEERRLRRQREAADLLNDIRIRGLQIEADAGDEAARRRLEELRITQDFVRQRERVNELLEDARLTDAERVRLKEVMLELDEQEEAALRNAGRRRMAGLAMPRLPSAVEAGPFVTGAAQQGREQLMIDSMNQQARSLKEIERDSTRQVTLLERLERVIERISVTTPARFLD